MKRGAEDAAMDALVPPVPRNPSRPPCLPQGNSGKSTKAPKPASNPRVPGQKMHPPCPQCSTAPPRACRCSRRKDQAFSKIEGCYSGACPQKVPLTPTVGQPPLCLLTLMFPSSTLIFWLLFAWGSWKGYWLPFKARAKMCDATLEEEMPPCYEGHDKLGVQTSKEDTARSTTQCCVHHNAGFSAN